MVDLIVIAIVVLIVGSALAYIIRAKKRGVKCIVVQVGSSETKRPAGHSEKKGSGCV